MRINFFHIAIFFIILTNQSFSQPFDSNKDKEKGTYILNGDTIEYPKHVLYAMLDSTLLADTAFLQFVFYFTEAQHSKIKYITISEMQSKVVSNFLNEKGILERVRTDDFKITLGRITIRLPDTMDALDVLPVFTHTRFFKDVHLGMFAYF